MLEYLSQYPELQGIIEIIKTGGFVVSILLLLSIFTGTVIIVKLLQFFSISLSGKKAINLAIKEWIAGNPNQALSHINKKKSPAAIVVKHLIKGINLGEKYETKVREDIERVATQQVTTMRSWFSAIEAIVQVAPLLGLFGTVIGMIEAFQNLQSAGSEVDPALLAGGIWVALLTTAAGLAVAIPAALALYWLEAMADKEEHYIETAITSILTRKITEQDQVDDNLTPANNAA